MFKFTIQKHFFIFLLLFSAISFFEGSLSTVEVCSMMFLGYDEGLRSGA